tara:strand:+ start:1474 stop:2514 length:1041 start_codon:yes stop_codon:yes gene_type:complete
MVNNPIIGKIYYFIYYYTHIILFIFFSFISILFESFLIYTFSYLEIGNFSYFFAINTGFIINFILNVNYNFLIKNYKKVPTFLIFVIISYISIFIQLNINEFISISSENYLYNRISSTLFIFIFIIFLHTKYTFKDQKKIGVAAYANYKENIIKIFNKVNEFPDFIHIDLVDNTFNKNASKIDYKIFENVKLLWPYKEVHLHIMSKNPLKHINKISEKIDVVIIHNNSLNKKKIIEKCKELKFKVGLCFFYNEKFDKKDNLYKNIDIYGVLSIKKPGVSGQRFQEQSYDLIKTINKYKSSTQKLFIDGGLNNNLIRHLNADYFVSASNLLLSNNPFFQFFKIRVRS